MVKRLIVHFMVSRKITYDKQRDVNNIQRSAD